MCQDLTKPYNPYKSSIQFLLDLDVELDLMKKEIGNISCNAPTMHIIPKQLKANQLAKKLVDELLGSILNYVEIKVFNEFDNRYFYGVDSQDIESTLEFVRNFDCEKQKVTGVLSQIGDGEYLEIWVTYNSRPYSDYCVFERVF